MKRSQQDLLSSEQSLQLSALGRKLAEVASPEKCASQK
jgi:hypothetical protein